MSKKSEPTSVISFRVPTKIKDELVKEVMNKGTTVNDLCLELLLNHHARKSKCEIKKNEMTLYDKIELFRFIKDLNHASLFNALIKISKKI